VSEGAFQARFRPTELRFDRREPPLTAGVTGVCYGWSFVDGRRVAGSQTDEHPLEFGWKNGREIRLII
jgi:hypothetical protein